MTRRGGRRGLAGPPGGQWHPKVDDRMRAVLATLLIGSPEDDGWARPTWTQGFACTASWQGEYESWKRRRLDDFEPVYVWADGICVKAGLARTVSSW